jgi:hypothetical protein
LYLFIWAPTLKFISFPLPVPTARAARATVAIKAEKKELMMWESLREGLDEEMERDPTVCLMGTLLSMIITTVQLYLILHL